MNDPKHIGPYKVDRSLGVGGMGIVYLARPKRGQRGLVAIKVLRPEYLNHDEAKKRFIAEIDSLKALQHPHIVPLLDYNIEGNMIWFAMPFFPQGTLKDALRHGKRFTPREVCRLLSQVADAIDYAHDRKYLHRDIKPENILLDERGNAVLTDFGIAKHEDDENLTNPGLAMGTAKYMSRARKAGAPATRQTDVYALGVIIYQLLSNDIPLAQIEETWRYTAIPAPLLEVVAKAAAEYEENSFESAGEFARAFEAALGEPCSDAEVNEGNAANAVNVDNGPITAQVQAPRATFQTAATPSIARSVVDAISRSVQLPTPFTAPPPKQRWTSSLILALAAVGIFMVTAWMLRSNFDFLSQAKDTTPAVTQIAQADTATVTSSPSATSTTAPTQPALSVATTAAPTATPTSTSLPPTATSTATFTASPLPPTATALPSATSTFTALPPTVVPTSTPSPTPAYYVRKTFILQNTRSFDMLSLPPTTPCTPINITSPDDCVGKTLWIDLVPVSAGQYRLCVLSGTCSLMTSDALSGPATGLSWLNAATFCAWRGSNLAGNLPSRLPTDTEIGLLMAHSSNNGAITLPEWLAIDKNGVLIDTTISQPRAAVWDGKLPLQRAQLVDEDIEANRNFTFRCVMVRP